MVGKSPRVRQELAEGIGSLPGWCKGVHRKKIEICQKIIGGSRKACRELGRSCRPDILGSSLGIGPRFRRYGGSSPEVL
ncbi:hypothetical protein B296_00020459 [Ensete ventricosum]|uniref:Uncharacterized protein n=1 Tax=Ensete ventricosum TaxID=4639 RepID=A0A427AIB0_ENSVE|nr:hypothetical protein B296_00020459 [Ensete ventricosum]